MEELRRIFNEVRKARKETKTTQTFLAAELNLEQSNYCNIENGNLFPQNIFEIRNKAIHVLYPLLDEKIAELSIKLEELKQLESELKKQLIKQATEL